MHIRCPHCHHPVDVVANADLTDVACPSCGSHFSLLSEATTATYIPSPQNVAHFEMLERVGVGQFGAVWKARDKTLDRVVALKIPRAGTLSSEGAEYFFRDARAAAQLKHPNIVSVHEVGRDGDTLFIASDFIDGANLKDWLTARKLTPREAAELMIKIAEAVQHAHDRGVIHRDLKPGNILMDQHGNPHVADFGLAKRESGEITMTVDGQILGTPAYMSPEQARGKAHEADARSDIYALGVILFELLTGELPFRGEKRMLIVQILNDEPPSPARLNARIPRDLETICLRCLEKSPQRRYPSADELAQELRRYIRGQPILSRPIGRAARAWRWAKREPKIAALSLSLAATLIVGTVVATLFAIDAHDQATTAKLRADQLVIEKERAEQSELDIRKLTGIVLPTVFAHSSGLESAKASGVPTGKEWAKQVDLRIDREIAGGRLEIPIRHAVGAMWRDMGLLEEAQRQLEIALRLTDAALSKPNDQTDRDLAHRRLAIRNSLALCFTKMGRHDDAIRLHQENYQDAKRSNNSQTLVCLINLSVAQATANKLPESCDAARQALELANSAELASIRQVLTCAGPIWQAAKSTKRVGEVLGTLDALSLASAKLAPNDTARLNFSHIYAIAYWLAAPNQKKSLELLQAAYLGRRDALGPDNRDTLASQEIYARALLDRGDAAAVAVLVDLRNHTFRNPLTPIENSLRTSLDLVDAYQGRSEFGAAERVLNETFADQTGNWPNNLHILLRMARGKNRLALRLFAAGEEDFRWCGDKLKMGTAIRAEVDCQHGACLLGMGRNEEAAKYLKRGYDVLESQAATLSGGESQILNDTRRSLEKLAVDKSGLNVAWKQPTGDAPRAPVAPEP